MDNHTLLRTVADKGLAQVERSQLQRFDWLLAALDIFIDEGIEAVRITRLAGDLGVTRGSFYWHFTNRADLVDSLVAYWRDKNTSVIVEAVTKATSLSDGIFRFFDTCVDASQFDPKLDLALREWARRSYDIRQQIDLADTTRIQAITDFFTRFDYPMPQALIRARVIYFAQIGFYALDVKEALSTRLSYTEAYYECFTGKILDSGEADLFRKRIMQQYLGELP
ncbi:MAG: TetR/AcrR family transcriptional regulator [Gammaproteobacteria bacterium]|nr:TetR/AcrR family transcriptional regulator [Gammaproteobacteria bacterium]